MEEDKKRFKYVRTTDGRIVSLCGVIQESIHVSSNGKVIYVSDRHNPLCVYKIPYVKQAETIEELCDCYLEDWGKGIPVIITKDMFANAKNSTWGDIVKRKVLRKEITFYACIVKRDCKGTHIEPVAKMNEKGEFELL